MGQYRKRPVIIEAVQLIEGQPTPEGVNFGCPCGDTERCSICGKYWIQTLEGPMIASYNDWIITGVKGERYACKPDIFEATYEPALDREHDASAVLAKLEGLGAGGKS